MEKKDKQLILAIILVIICGAVAVLVWLYIKPLGEQVPAADTSAELVNIAASGLDEMEEPQPTVSHEPLDANGQLHLSSFVDSTDGLVPSLYSFDPADWSQSSLDWVGGKDEFAFGATDDTVYYGTAQYGTDGNTTLYSFDKQYTESTELVAGGQGRALSAIVSADGETMIYRDQCGIFCVDDSADATTTIYQYDLASGEQQELWSEAGVAQGFKTPQYWLDENTVVLEQGFESTEMPQTVTEMYLLDVSSGELETVRLGNSVRAYDFSPDGSQIALAVFNYDQDDDVVDSAVQILTRSSGEKETIVQSSTEHYDNLRWEDSSNLLVFVQAVESVKIGLGEYVQGPFFLQRMTLGGETELLMNLAEKDIITLGMVGGRLYYLATDLDTPPDRGRRNQVFVYDPATQESTSLLVSQNNIDLESAVHKY
ncbi:hypothetical protein ACFL2M_02335 [Patescibacteria group bacterium]